MVNLRDADWASFNGEVRHIPLAANHESWFGDVTPGCRAGGCLERGQAAGAAAQA